MLEPLFSLRNQAEFYHRQLPEKARRYLNSRGVTDSMIERYTVGWNGSAITIPVENESGAVVFLKTATPPAEGAGVPVFEIPHGAQPELYPWRTLTREIGRVVIAANELECLALEARGFLAVASTHGAETFKAEWVRYFEAIDRVYVLLGRSEASDRAARKIVELMPRAIVVPVPEEAGPKGGVAECIARLGYTRNDFEALVARASCGPIAEADEASSVARYAGRAARIKAAVPIAKVIAEYTPLRGKRRLLGRCPLHDELQPTLKVDPATNTFQCFFCGAKGDAINFLEIVEGLTYGQALEALEKIFYSDDESAA